MKKILLLCASSNSVRNFRLPLIERFQKEGFRVGICTFDDDNKELIEGLNVDYFCISTYNRSLKPSHLMKLSKEYAKLMRDYEPDVVFTFVLKPNTLGVLAANKVGVKKIFSMVEGAGDVFINKGLKWKIIRSGVCNLYKKSFKHSEKVFFLNNDDKEEFVKRKLVKNEQCEIIHGVGVDLEKFNYRPTQNTNIFLMVARMLKSKGVYEYCACARQVKKLYPEAVFNYLGAEGTVKIADIQEYIDDGSINYLGTTKDVRPYIENAGIFVLPSYREGMPMSVMEAESIGRAVIVSDSVGCKDTVCDGYNGFIVPCGDCEKMTEKVIWCIEHPDEVKLFGKNSRKIAEEKFDQKIINEKIIQVINNE